MTITVTIQLSLVGCVVLASLAGSSLARAEVERELRDRFLKGVQSTDRLSQGLSIHVRLESVFERSQAAIDAEYSPQVLTKLRQRGQDPSRDVVSGEYAVRRNAVMQSGVRHNGVSFVLAQNEEYAFQISKGEAVDTYTIQWLERNGAADARAEEAIRRRRGQATGVVTGVWCVFGEPLTRLVNSDGFEIRQINESSSDAGTLVRVDFERMQEDFRPGGTLSDAYLVLDPSNAWALVEYGATWHDVEGRPFMRKEVIQDVGESVNGVPILNSMKGTNTWIQNQGVDRETTTLEVLSRDVPEDAFQLSGYGLPEPNFEREWYQSWLTYLLGSVLCLAVAYAIRRRGVAV